MKKSILKITTAVCLCTCLSGGLSCMTANAATWRSKTINSFKMFEKEWEKTVTYKLASNGTKIGTMTYGYDTDWFDEDYVWTKSTEGDTLAEIQRISVDPDLVCGSRKSANKYSKIEVAHKNSNIKYQIKFYATYGATTESQSNSTKK